LGTFGSETEESGGEDKHYVEEGAGAVCHGELYDLKCGEGGYVSVGGREDGGEGMKLKRVRYSVKMSSRAL